MVIKIIRYCLGTLFLLLAIGTAVATAYVCRYADTAKPVVEDYGPGSPTDVLQSFFTCLETKDWEGAYSYLSNYSTLGLENEPDDAVSAMFWKVQQDAWHFQIADGYEMNGQNLTKRAVVTSVDLSPLVPQIHAQVQETLEKAVEDARLESDVYDDDGNYREELVYAALEDAVRDAVQDVSPYTYTRELTMRMSYLDGRWLVAADNELLTALTGGAVR